MSKYSYVPKVAVVLGGGGIKPYPAILEAGEKAVAKIRDEFLFFYQQIANNQ